MSLDSLGHEVQRVAEGKQEPTKDVECVVEHDEPQDEEEQQKRRKAYDTISIADSTLGSY